MIVRIKKLPKDAPDGICLLARDIFRQLKLSHRTRYTLHVGRLKMPAIIRPDNSSSTDMLLTRPIFNGLLLYSDARINIWKKNRDIYLGPVVGVFVNNRYLEDIEKGCPPVSAQKHMQANEKACCLTYYFSIERINWVDNWIKGYTYIHSLNKWKYYRFALADVIYDRGVNFLDNEKLLVRHIRRQLDYHPKIRVINSRNYLGKWQLYNALAKYGEIKKYLPETILYSDFAALEDMLLRYDFVFVKASLGSRGREVLSIRRLREGYEVVSHQNRYRPILLRSKEGLKDHIEGMMGDRLYIVQQGIGLLKVNDRNMDMRVLIEKDGQGKWQAIYNQVRMARPGSTITNYSAGGDIANYSDVYPLLMEGCDNDQLPDDKKIRETTIKIAEYIEKEFGPFGELGMDMALDDKGRLWFIEANTKPDKDPEPGLEDIQGISPQFLSVLEYGKYLFLDGLAGD